MPGLTLAQVVKKGLELPSVSQELSDQAPGTGEYGKKAAAARAHGRIPDSGCVLVECEDTATLTLYVYSPTSRKFRFPGTDSGSYQKEFTETHGHIDFFEGPAGALFEIVSTVDEITIYHNGDDV